MKIVSTNVYAGPNLYANFPVIRFLIELGPLEEWPTAKLGRGFINSLLKALPGLHEHGCSYEVPGGFVRRMTEDEGTWLGHVWEHVAIELQCIAGTEVSFGKIRSTSEYGQYNMLYQYRHPDVGLKAGYLARDLILNLLPKKVSVLVKEKAAAGFNFRAEKENFIRFAQSLEFGPSTASLVKAAQARNIPHIRLSRGSLVQFGQGKYQRRIQATVTSETRHIAVEIACDKEDTHNLLADLGLPVPKQKIVITKKEAVEAATEIGFPVVVKPLNANHGKGVSTDLMTPEEVKKAFDFAGEYGSSITILVESFVRGHDHRLLVVNGELIAAAQRVRGHVVGDGIKTISELVEKINSDPRRGIGHEKILTRIVFDRQANKLMKDKGYTRNTVPAKGEVVYLRSTANLSTGGTAIDVTDIMHPDNRDMAVRAVKAIGLDVGGVDFLTEDITKSYKEIGGAIVEVNAAPGFRMHVSPTEGKPRNVAEPVMNMLFPQGTPSRIPIAAITGTNGKTTTARMLAHILKTAGHIVGMTTTDGVYIDGHLTVPGDMTGPKSAQMVLMDPSVDIAVMETARGGLLRSGMGYEYCDVGAVLNVSSDHLGMKGINSIEELAEVKRIVIDVAKETAVLNADDLECLKMADYAPSKNICYVTMNQRHSLVREHIKAGGQAFVLEKGISGDMIVLYDKEVHIPLIMSHLIPATQEGRAMHNVSNAMFAAALAVNLGKKLEDITHGLRTFYSNFFQAPGRMNIFDKHPFKVILDYGHNQAAIEAVGAFVDNLEVQGRRLCVISAPGDRRDEDIINLAKAASGHFGRFICKGEDDLRGRKPGEVPELLKKSLVKSGVKEQNIKTVLDEQDAVRLALESSEPGDLVVIFGDKIARCWDQITGFDSSRTRSSRNQNIERHINKKETGGFSLEKGQTLIRDERGVRIARD